MVAIDQDSANQSAETVGVRSNVTTGVSADIPGDLSTSGNRGKFLDGLDEEAKARDFHTSQFLNAMSAAPTGDVSIVASAEGTAEAQEGLSAVQNGEMVAAAATAELTSDGSTTEYRAKLKNQIMHGARSQVSKSSFKPNQSNDEKQSDKEALSNSEKQGIAEENGIDMGLADAEKEGMENAIETPMADKNKEGIGLAMGEPEPSVLENPLRISNENEIAAPNAAALFTDVADELFADLRDDGLEELGASRADNFISAEADEFLAAFDWDQDKELEYLS